MNSSRFHEYCGSSGGEETQGVRELWGIKEVLLLKTFLDNYCSATGGNFLTHTPISQTGLILVIKNIHHILILMRYIVQ